MKLPTLKGKRVNLRRLRLSDADDCFAYATDREVSRWVPNIPYPYKPKDAVTYIRGTWSTARKKQGYPFGIEEAATGRIIGGMLLHNISPTHRSGEIGYALNRRYWRQGYMSEAVRLICRFAFRDLKLNRLWATVIVPNMASAELLFKLGFTLEGTLRQGMRVRGRYYDVHVFGLLHSEYRSR